MIRHDAEGAVGGDEGHAAVELREAVEAEGTAERPLAGVAADLESIESGTSRRDVDTQSLAGLVATTLASPLDDSVVVLLGRQASTIGLVATGATLDTAVIERDLRTAARAIQQRHRRIVRAAVLALLALGNDPAALGDPDTVGALQALEASIEDLDRLRNANDLAARMTAIRPGAVREFRQRIREWCRMLGRDASRSEGAAAIDALERDLERFTPLPAEAWLAEGGPTMISRTGGRGKELLDRMTETRRRWADEVFHGRSTIHSR